MFVFSHTDFEYYTLLVGHFCGRFKETGPSSFNLPPKLFVWAFFLCSLYCVCYSLEKPPQLHIHLPCPPSPLLEELSSCPLSPLRSLHLPRSLCVRQEIILCWLAGNFTALHLCVLQVDLFSILGVMCWIRLPEGAFFPDMVCLHVNLWWKACGSVCLNVHINQK